MYETDARSIPPVQLRFPWQSSYSWLGERKHRIAHTTKRQIRPKRWDETLLAASRGLHPNWRAAGISFAESIFRNRRSQSVSSCHRGPLGLLVTRERPNSRTLFAAIHFSRSMRFSWLFACARGTH